MKASHIGAIVLALSGLVSFAVSAADIEAGKAKSAVCAACHGADGNSANPAWPSLAGQHATYIYKQLNDYKAGRRVNASMTGMVALLNDQDMKNVAAYFESQKLKSNAFDADLIEDGQNIYRGGIVTAQVAACIGCHSPNGRGNGPAGWPSLKGQHPGYIVSQLQMFRQGTRANDAGRMMGNVAARMSDREMEAVAAYIAGMQ
ncbi:MAG: cytochrome c4 [Gammaproteobacteria bacterium]|nr:cytochrome c4 [Gammaproteobacteria bacterium]MDH3534322.1 cytochrome c4 [Gammaproteobacteria bacterium]